MKTTAIIAEYNPFHKGHAYQLDYVRHTLHADRIIVIMSGDFVQRGEPAIVDKYIRTGMALTEGADMVMEMPIIGATASAEAFAGCGVAIANALGCVDELVFGCETADVCALDQVSSLLAHEPEDYQVILKDQLKAGTGFPAARARALTTFTGNEEAAQILSSPNNILAIEYMKALKRTNSPIQPVPMKRLGSGYHDMDLSGPCPSASAIRAALYAFSFPAFGHPSPLTQADVCPVDLSEKLKGLPVPEKSLKLLTDYLLARPILSLKDFDDQIGLMLLSNCHRLSEISDIDPDLSDRILHFLDGYTGIEAFTDLLLTRNYTGTRLQRALVHLLLNITKQDYDLWKRSGYASPLQVLGFRKRSADLFRQFDLKNENPLIINTADRDKLTDPHMLKLHDQTLYSSRLYRQMQNTRSGKAAKPILSEPVIVL